MRVPRFGRTQFLAVMISGLLALALAPAPAEAATARDLAKGCYRLSPNLPNGTWVSFCLRSFGSSYTVRGNEFCRGDVRWRIQGGRFVARLQATSDCESGRTRPPAQVSCRIGNMTGQGLGDSLFFDREGDFKATFPFIDRPRCTYSDETGFSMDGRATRR